MPNIISPKDIWQKKIIFSCFDWGYGHLSRSISLLLQLQKQENNVLFVGEVSHIHLLQQYGFQGSVLEHPGSRLMLKGSGNFFLEGLLNIFKGPAFIRRDQKLVRDLVKSFSPDFVISDHRYGFRSNKVTSIFCTHQLQLPLETPSLVKSMHRNWVNQFSFSWIFDDEQERLAGDLAVCTEKSCYIGYFSRFQSVSNAVSEIPGKIVAIISGPEPYNAQLLALITKLSVRFSTKITVICSPHLVTASVSAIEFIHDWRQADKAVLSAEWIVSRNGYTTLMDLRFLNKKALLLVTPGQLEQVYFAEINKLLQQRVHQVGDDNAFEKQWELLFNRHSS